MPVQQVRLRCCGASHRKDEPAGAGLSPCADARPRGGTRSCALPIPGPRGSAALRGNRMNIHISFAHNQQPPRQGATDYRVPFSSHSRQNVHDTL
jgi:hypothetical protein